jgi:hypothetical protein
MSMTREEAMAFLALLLKRLGGAVIFTEEELNLLSSEGYIETECSAVSRTIKLTLEEK